MDANDRPRPAESDEPATVESAPRAPTAPVPQEILAWYEEGYYPNHWGINE